MVGAVDGTGRDDGWGPCMNGVLGKENDRHFLYSLVWQVSVLLFFPNQKKKKSEGGGSYLFDK